MKKSKLTLTQKRIIIIGTGVLLILLTLIFIFMKNLNKVSRIERNITQLNVEYSRLSMMQADCDTMKEAAPKQQAQMESYLGSFPSKYTQTSIFYQLYMMQRDTGIDMTQITPSDEVTFYRERTLMSEEDILAAKEQADEEAANGETTTDGEDSANVAVTGGAASIENVEGKLSTYTVSFEGTYDETMKAMAWVINHKEPLSLGPISLSFDSSTGSLIGTIQVNFYAMKNNGVPYKAPDVSEIQSGSDNVFGTFKNKG